jgi:hypothetical protein
MIELNFLVFLNERNNNKNWKPNIVEIEPSESGINRLKGYIILFSLNDFMLFIISSGINVNIFIKSKSDIWKKFQIAVGIKKNENNNSVINKIFILSKTNALKKIKSPIKDPDIINDDLNWVAPINKVTINIKSIILIFLSFIKKYNAAVVINWGNNINFGPDINWSIVGELSIKTIKKLNLFLSLISFFKNKKNNNSEKIELKIQNYHFQNIVR